MKFAFNVKVVGRNGSPAQLIIAAHPAETVASLAKELNQSDFIVVEQFYKQDDGGMVAGGETILGTAAIGKVREYKSRQTVIDD